VRGFLAIVLLAGCAATVPPDAPPAPALAPPEVVRAEPPVATKPVVKPVPQTTDPLAVVATLSPAQLPHAATKSLDDATDYVLWRLARPENIDALTPLTEKVSRAMKRMKDGEVNGRYQDQDVVAARSALLDLRLFLRTKGD
jgi:hypothetical protein